MRLMRIIYYSKSVDQVRKKIWQQKIWKSIR